MAAGTTSKKAAAKAVGKPAKAPKSATEKVASKATAPARARVPFPKKNQPPSEAEFVARLPLATGKKFENVRTFLKKQSGVIEDLYFYGPKTGWAYRYRHGGSSLGTIMIHEDRLVGIVALDAAALGEVDFTSLSDVGERARRLAHGSPSLSWLDLPLDGPGASDFKVLLKAKLRTLPQPAPAPDAAPAPAADAGGGPNAAGSPPPRASSAAAAVLPAPPPPPSPPAPATGRGRKASGR